MRREELYLQDIVEAADHIARFVAESGLSGFRESEMVRSAIVQKLAVIGEAASRVSDERRIATPKCCGQRSWPSATFSYTRTSA